MPPPTSGTPEGEKCLFSIRFWSLPGTPSILEPVLPALRPSCRAVLETNAGAENARAHKLGPAHPGGPLPPCRPQQTGPPTGLTHPNRAQRLTAQATTELLRDVTAARHEHDVAAGTCAARNFFARRLVTALARRLLADRTSRRTRGATFPIPASLLPTLLTPGRAPAVFPRRTPTRPATSGLTAGRAAIAAQRVRRPKQTPTPFQQATPQPPPTHRAS